MTYPPPGGGNPQYQLQPEPQQPSDPYSQGYNSTPPPGNYYQQPPPQQYTQPPSQPMMPPQVGVQPGYPSAPGSILPPPLPPAKQGGNLPVILGVVVVLVVVLGIAAVLIIPGLVNSDDEDPQSEGGTSENAEPSKEEEASSDPVTEPSAEETADAGGGGFEVWGPPSSSDDFDAASPEGVAIAYQVAQNNGDDEAMQALVSADATSAMVSDLEWEIEDTTEPYPYPYWGMAYEADDGSMRAWAGWTMDDTAPDDASDVIGGYTYTLVQEDGVWKLYDLEYGLVE